MTRTLAEGLGLADGPADDRWIAFREQRTSLEYLRSVAEIRERGLHVRLHAYETRVFLEMRELHDGAGLWRRLAERLGERGVPSLEEELRYQQLGPVHDAVRAAIVDWSRDGEPGMDARGSGSWTRWPTRPGRPATGTLSWIGSSSYYTAALQVADEIDDPSETAALLVWSLLAPLGTLPDGAMVGPTSRAWYEELRLAPVVADALRSRGLDEGVAWWAAERVHTLLDLPLPSMLGGPAETLPLRLVDAWLSHPAVRPFIRVNAWDGVEWFHRESWDELLAWVERLEWILSPEDARPPRPVERSALETTLTDAADVVRLPRGPAARGPGGQGRSLNRSLNRSPSRSPSRAGRARGPSRHGVRAGARPAGRARAGEDRPRAKQGREAQEVVQGGQGQEAQEVPLGRPRQGGTGRTTDSPPGRNGGAIEEVGPDSGGIAADLLDLEPEMTPGCVRTGR